MGTRKHTHTEKTLGSPSTALPHQMSTRTPQEGKSLCRGSLFRQSLLCPQSTRASVTPETGLALTRKKFSSSKRPYMLCSERTPHVRHGSSLMWPSQPLAAQCQRPPRGSLTHTVSQRCVSPDCANKPFLWAPQVWPPSYPLPPLLPKSARRCTVVGQASSAISP